MREWTDETVVVATVVVARVQQILLLLLLVVVVLVVDVGVVRVVALVLLSNLVVRQLDVAAAPAAYVAHAPAAAHVAAVRVGVDRRRRLGLAAGRARCVGAVLSHRHGVVVDPGAAARGDVRRVSVVDEDGAASALLAALATLPPPAHRDHHGGRHQDDGQRHADAEPADQRQLQQRRLRVQPRQRRRHGRGRRRRRALPFRAVVAGEAGPAAAQVRTVRQRNARGAVQTPTLAAERRVAVGAAAAGEPARTGAREVGDQIAARPAVQARRAGAVVDVGLAQHAREARIADAPEVVERVDAASAVEARAGAAVIDVPLADRALVAGRTDTLEPVHSVHAQATYRTATAATVILSFSFAHQSNRNTRHVRTVE